MSRLHFRHYKTHVRVSQTQHRDRKKWKAMSKVHEVLHAGLETNLKFQALSRWAGERFQGQETISVWSPTLTLFLICDINEEQDHYPS